MSTLTPNPNSSKIILLTGINGYIASHIAFQLLQKGYTVRGTSRSPSTPQRLLSNPAFSSISPSSLQHVVVPDITVPGAFTVAVKDVHAIIHTASPVDFTLKSADDYFLPARDGMLSILQSAYEENWQRGGKIVSFVLTSSISAVVDRWRFPPVSMGGTENRAYTEADWNISGEKVARESEKSGQFLPLVAYGASKSVAERAMWQFVKERNQETSTAEGVLPGLACSAVCPGVCTGPTINWPDSPEGLNSTVKPVWDIWSGRSKKENVLPFQIGGASYIDVRDVAAIHIWCMEHPEESGGERYLMTNGKAPPQGTADVLRDILFKDDEKVRERIIVGTPGAGWVDGFGWPEDEPTVKATKAYKAMGVERFRGFEISILDTVMAFRERWPEYGL